MIELEIGNKIVTAHRGNAFTTVAFCGAADLGKSYLADKVVKALNQTRSISSHLPLDAFLLDRAERQQRNISGYDPRAHDLVGIQSVLRQWKQGRAIKFRPYNHHTGRKSEHFETVKKNKVLLTEGLFSLHDSLLPFIDLSFFIYTDDEKLKAIKLAADLVKRGYSPEYAKEIYDAEFALYQEHIAPQKGKATYKVRLQEQWKYHLEE